RRSDWAGEKTLEMIGANRAFWRRNRIAVRIMGGASEHFIDSFDEPLRYDVFELFSLLVHFSPAHPHHLYEKQLNQTMASQDQPAAFRPSLRQAYAAVRLVFRQP